MHHRLHRQRPDFSLTHTSLTRSAACLALVWLALTSIGCERARELLGAEPEPAGPPAKSVNFEVDDDGIFYATLADGGRLIGADRLSRIPLAERVAVVVHVRGETAEFEGRYYVADLLDARPKDTATAYLRSADHVRKLLEVGELAARRGIGVRDVVHDLAGVRADGRDDANRGVVRNDQNKPGVTRSKGNKSSDKLPSVPGEFEAREVEQLNMDDEAIELFADTEITSKTGAVTASDGAGQKIQIHRLSGSSAVPSDAPGSPVTNAGYWKSVTLYYADWCGVCRKAKRWLDANNVPYKAVDIDASKENKAEMVRFCRSKGARPGAVPTFRIDGDTIMQGWGVESFTKLAKQ